MRDLSGAAQKLSVRVTLSGQVNSNVDRTGALNIFYAFST